MDWSRLNHEELCDELQTGLDERERRIRDLMSVASQPAAAAAAATNGAALNGESSAPHRGRGRPPKPPMNLSVRAAAGAAQPLIHEGQAYTDADMLQSESHSAAAES